MLPGAVTSLEHLGDRVRVAVACPCTPPLHADITTAALADLRLAPGSPVRVAVKATDLGVYPAS